MALENLSEAVMVVTDHALDSVYGCSTDQERVELIVDLIEEFFQVWISENEAEQLLNLARKGHIVDLEEGQFGCYTIIPNTHYEIIVNFKSFYYWGCLYNLESLSQLEEVKLWEK